ncbi:MAG: GAF and ANTAR domain-containing protein [Actinomycetia bacterium]|nr:GAF and ANTAR domain-containing protein [Actinomycetes bacterium]
MSREQRLARVFVELADTLIAEFDVIDLMQTLADRSVELLHADAAGLMLADQRGRLRVIASSEEAAQLLEIFELQNSEGPCLDCFLSGQPVVNLEAETMQTRWPNFWPRCAAAGYRSVHALPMRLRDEVIGAINLFSHSASKMSTDDMVVGQAFADVATIGLLQERAVQEKPMLAEQLQSAHNSRVIVEQARGVLAERAGVSVDQAFTTMRTYARTNGLGLTSVASQVIDGSLDGGELQPT